jgi:hypothetical protein
VPRKNTIRLQKNTNIPLVRLDNNPGTVISERFLQQVEQHRPEFNKSLYCKGAEKESGVEVS